MENKEQIIELLDAYLKGSLSGKEKKELEDRFVTDPALKKEWEAHQQMVADLERIAWRNEQREKIKTILNQESASGRTIPIRTLVALAAAILLLVVTIFLIDPFSIQRSKQDLVNKDSLSENQSEMERIPDTGLANNSSQGETPEEKGDKAGMSRNIKSKIFVKQLILKEGEMTPGTGTQEVLVEIRTDEEQILKYQFGDKELVLFTGQSGEFSPTGLKIVELQEANKLSRFYLNSNEQWYLLVPDGKVKDLQQEQDKTILGLLNED